MKITECPRDAMQGIKDFIPTDLKIKYLNQLLKVGFNSLDFGSFVSPKAIPQLKDTSEIVSKLDLSGTDTKLLSVIGNLRGAEIASEFDEITYFGFPYSLSATLLKLNINSDRISVLKTIEQIQNICIKKNKKLVIYFSLAFGNPYGDVYTNQDIIDDISLLKSFGIENINMADTLGIASPEKIATLFSQINQSFPDFDFGFHLHTSQHSWYEKIHAAVKNGCNHFDTVLNGYGGCPMTGSELIGNLDTYNLLLYFLNYEIETNLNKEELAKASEISVEIFKNYH